MQRIEVNSLGFNLTKEVPSTVEEYNALDSKRENACLDDAVSNTLYRGTLAEFRGAVLEELGKLTGVERAVVKPAATEEDDDVYESEGKWFNRIKASKGITKNADLPAEWTAIAQKHMDAAAFDPSAKERSGDGPAIGKNDLKMADEAIARGIEKVRQIASFLTGKLGREIVFTGDEANKDVDRKTLARGLADWRKEKARQEEVRARQEMGL